MNELCCLLSPIAKVGSDAYCIGHIEALFKKRAEALFKDPLRKAAYEGEEASNLLNPTWWGCWKTLTSIRGKIKRRIIKREKYLTSPNMVAKMDQQIVDLRAEEATTILKKKDLNKQSRDLRKPKRQWDNSLRSRMLEGVGEDIYVYDYNNEIHVYESWASGQSFNFTFRGHTI